MTDIFTKEKRGKIMAKIFGQETKPEILVRKYLFSNGLRYRKNVKDLPGKPDIVLPKYRTVIFVNGCFWHGHPNCKKATLPTTNSKFWSAKIATNSQRDEKNRLQLKKIGWDVIVIWQCELRNKYISNLTLDKLIRILKEK